MSNSTRTTKAIFADFFFSLLTFPIALTVRAYVILSFYQWFFLAVFPNAPVLTIAHTIGLTFLLGLITLNMRKAVKEIEKEEKDGTKPSPYKYFFYCMGTYGIAELVGYIIFTYFLK